MELLFALLLGAAGGMWIYKRAMAKDAANFKAYILANYTGVWAVYPTSPWDETVEQRAAEIEAGFIEHGNTLPKYVQRYYFNDMVKGPGGPTSTAALGWQDCMVLFANDYLHRVSEFHTTQHQKDPQSTAQFLAGQKQSLNTL